MDNLFFQRHGTATIVDNTVVIDFSELPLKQLVALRQLNEGMNAKTCDSWAVAARAVRDALMRYIDTTLEPYIEIRDFALRIRLKDPSMAFQPIVQFFERGGISIEDGTQPVPRSRAVARSVPKD